MIKVGPKRRKLSVLNQNERFYCSQLSCKISYRDCGMRHIKGAALRKGDNWALVPEKWARYATPCRSCRDGQRTASALGLKAPSNPGPNKPPTAPIWWRSKAVGTQEAPYRTCLKCPRLFRGWSDLCSRCRKQTRLTALREHKIDYPVRLVSGGV